MAFVFFGGVAGLVALGLAYWPGGTLKRTALALTAWSTLTVGWLLLVYFSAPRTDHPGGCSDCSDHFGRWIDTTAIFVVVGGNLVAWTLGTILGSTARSFQNRRRRRQPSSAHPLHQQRDTAG